MNIEIDLTKFYLTNIIDTCSVWNVLASSTLYIAAIELKCDFSFTQFVEYECIHKPRKQSLHIDFLLIEKLQNEIDKGKFKRFNITIDDLQEIELLANNKNLGKGELSSIAFAKKTNQAFFTDDKAARKLGKKILGNNMVQTTPHLVGHLFFNRILLDGDLSTIISEHSSLANSKWGSLEEFFKTVYSESMRLRFLQINLSSNK
jgi:predicted nucleic acid-binding protein